MKKINSEISAMPPLETLAYFDTVARTGSFSKAATKMCVTQSAVSKQIKNLELSLGFLLFERNSRGIELTPPGAELLSTTGPLMENLMNCIIRLKQWHEKDSVRVVCTHAVAHYWLFPRLVKFSYLHPEISVNVISTNSITAASCTEHDFAILYGKGIWPGLETDKLFDEVVYPVCRFDYEVPDIKSPGDFLSLRLIQLDRYKWNWMNWKDWFSHYEIPFTPEKNMLTYNQATLTLNASAQGLGIALGWDFMTKELIKNKTIRKVSRYVYATGNSDFLAHQTSSELSPAAKEFKKFIINGG